MKCGVLLHVQSLNPGPTEFSDTNDTNYPCINGTEYVSKGYGRFCLEQNRSVIYSLRDMVIGNFEWNHCAFKRFQDHVSKGVIGTG